MAGFAVIVTELEHAFITLDACLGWIARVLVWLFSISEKLNETYIVWMF